jgi:hypothetical protein
MPTSAISRPPPAEPTRPATVLRVEVSAAAAEYDCAPTIFGIIAVRAGEPIPTRPACSVLIR